MDFVKEASAPDKVETQGLIPAEELPSAASALAELFPEDPAPPIGDPEGVEAAISIPRDPAPRPKRRSIFSRFFSPKRPSTVQEEPSAALHVNGNGKPKEGAAKTASPETSAVKAPGEPSAVQISNMEKPAATPIAASDLPSAAQALAELFPPEAAEAVSEPARGQAEGLLDAVDIEAVVESLSPSAPVTIEASTDAVIPPATELADASVSVVPETEANVLQPPAEDVRAEAPEEKSIPPHEIHPDESVLSTASLNTEDTENIDDSGERALVEKLDEENAPQSQETAESPARKPYKNWAFDDKLASHKEWIDSHGLSGKRADLAGANLEAADL
ncbi:MAG TPA: hypothetical protein VGR97_14085, partial [Candidatus Acidoferrales bacterium]|nr:hypothetical protein [Candidatus Acidoferrales bacterium]